VLAIPAIAAEINASFLASDARASLAAVRQSTPPEESSNTQRSDQEGAPLSHQISDFDLGLLLTLDTLLKEQNVTHAATRLNITQSALSARLTRLRQLLNDPLFIPAASGRGMIPTPHATALRPELSRLIDA